MRRPASLSSSIPNPQSAFDKVDTCDVPLGVRVRCDPGLKKIKNLKNGKPSEKKSVEKHDLKKDEEMDEEDEEKIEESDAELTKEQKTLPPKLQEMILKKKKEKKD